MKKNMKTKIFAEKLWTQEMNEGECMCKIL